MIKSKLNLYLYSLLLVVTPFLLLQNYLQDAIGKLSLLTFHFFGVELKVVLFLVVLFGGLSLVLIIRYYTRNRLLGFLFVIILLCVGYSTSDYYFNHHFYDIQHNWHYIAYALFAWLAWLHYFNKTNNAEKSILKTFILALTLSLIDELIQVYISSRVFDLSDVAKDLWGCMIGQFFLHFVLYDQKYVNFKSYWQKGIRNWRKNGAWLLTLELLISYIFLNVSSLLTDEKYLVPVFFITLIVFFIFAFLFQSLGIKKTRYSIFVLLALILFYPSLRLCFSEPNLNCQQTNRIVYKGIPVIYFDVMIYPNGLMRFVDKKIAFNSRDKQKINSVGADIVLLATGSRDQGGKGYQDQLKVEMCYNYELNKVYQLIKLPNKKACKLYNRLVEEGKEVLMIIHNS